MNLRFIILVLAEQSAADGLVNLLLGGLRLHAYVMADGDGINGTDLRPMYLLVNGLDAPVNQTYLYLAALYLVAALKVALFRSFISVLRSQKAARDGLFNFALLRAEASRRVVLINFHALIRSGQGGRGNVDAAPIHPAQRDSYLLLICVLLFFPAFLNLDCALRFDFCSASRGGLGFAQAGKQVSGLSRFKQLVESFEDLTVRGEFAVLFTYEIGLNRFSVALQKTEAVRDAPVAVQSHLIRINIVERQKINAARVELDVVECRLAESGDIDHAFGVNRVAQKLVILSSVIQVALRHVVSAVSSALVKPLHRLHHERRRQHL